ncbi:MAG: hypothetical protein HIU92_21160 [Proteobacteria bacterium]|nr:hypothetical protein [Pseudomonadota bacterium]
MTRAGRIVRRIIAGQRRGSTLGVPFRSAVAGLALTCVISIGGAQAAESQDPSFELANGTIMVRPYVLNQFDLGTAWGPGTRNPTGGLNIRRLRYGATVKLPDDVSIGLVWDFGDSGYAWPQYRSTGLYEADVHYAGLKPFTVTAGVFAPNLTLEAGERSADKLFAADPTIVDLVSSASANGGQLGLQVGAHRARWLVEATLTGGQIGDSSTSRYRGVLARAAGLVVKTHDLAVHVGVSAASSLQLAQEPGSAPAIDYSATAEYGIQGRSEIDTGAIPAQGTVSAGPEFGLAYGPLWVQGEWYRTLVDRTNGPTPGSAGGMPRQPGQCWAIRADGGRTPPRGAPPRRDTASIPRMAIGGRWRSAAASRRRTSTAPVSRAANRASGRRA